MKRPLIALATCLTLAASCLAACTPTAPQQPTPKLVWDNGITPSGPLEKDPAVKALRRALIGEAMAGNTFNFALTQLTDNETPEAVSALASGSQRGMVQYDLGPTPIVPVKRVQRGKDVILLVCTSGILLRGVKNGGGIAYGDPGLTYDAFYMTPWKNTYRLAYGGFGKPNKCPKQTLPVARFTPAPTGPATTDTKTYNPPYRNWKKLAEQYDDGLDKIWATPGLGGISVDHTEDE